VLKELASDFKKKNNRNPTFWFHKCCIDQYNVKDGLKMLPINVMACEKVTKQKKLDEECR